MKYIDRTIGLMLLCLMVFATGCRRDNLLQPEATPIDAPSAELSIKGKVPGEAIIKLKPEANNSPSELRALVTNQLRSLSKESEVELEPIFRIGGEYEALQKEAGLHLWYKLKFDPEISLAEALRQLQSDESIEIAQGNDYVKPAQATYTPVASLRAMGDNYNDGYPAFNTPDPLLRHQWHYQNNGDPRDPYFVKGADINLFKAWAKETGKKDVVVAVIDSGIDGEHEDLKGSLWDNPEHAGTYGYNFYDDSYIITPGFHGTHVAGTIAARNNNGIGVSGIAGGDGTPDSGVRLMSIQIFDKDNLTNGRTKGATIDKIAKGFQWATEHGANIANCSWGFNENDAVPNDFTALKASIEYFINNAGVDPKTHAQKANARMKGGVVIFASGNDSYRNQVIYPSSYESVIAVASFAANMKIAEYSNIADWIDITAPGGTMELTWRIQSGVLSTISSTFESMPIPGTSYHGSDLLFKGSNGNSKYASQQGTSMAAPHVTGIAALVLSKFGKQGYTNQMLKERLLSSVKQIDVKSLNNKKYRDWIGTGYIDAVRALEEDNKAVPEAPKLSMSSTKPISFTEATITWLPCKDQDAIDGFADRYELILTTKQGEVQKATIPNYGDQANTPIEYTFTDLADGTEYHAEVIAKDRWGNSAKSSIDFTTKANQAPRITNLPASLPLILSKNLPFSSLSLNIEDPDGHSWKLKEPITATGVKATTKPGKGLHLLFLIPNIEIGDYQFAIKLEDELGKVSTTELSYKVVAYQPIKQIADFGVVTLKPLADPMQIELSDKFVSPSGLKLHFEVKSLDENVAATRLLPNTSKLEITPKKVGTTMVQIIVSDGTKDFTSGFTVSVAGSSEDKRAEGGTFILYPIPTDKILNIQTDEETALPREIIITSLRGELVHRQFIDRDKAGISHVNLEKLAPGVYRAHLGKTIRTIVKK